MIECDLTDWQKSSMSIKRVIATCSTSQRLEISITRMQAFEEEIRWLDVEITEVLRIASGR